MTLPQWKEFEILVAKIQKGLAANSVVTHNDRIMGRKSRQMRQIDVSIRGKVGQFDILIIIDCKDYAEPVDVKAVEEFMGLVEDVGAHQAAIVAAKGFTEAAKTRAIEAGLGVYTVVDTDPHKWQVQVFMPVLCDFRGATFYLQLQFSQPKPFQIPYDHNKWIVFDINKNILGPVSKLLAAEWNDGDLLPIEEGEHKDLDFLGQPVLMDNGYGELLPIKITTDLVVEKRLYYGKLSVKQISGFKNEKNGVVTTRKLTTILNVETVEKEWKQINSEDELTVKPIMTFTASDCYIV